MVSAVAYGRVSLHHELPANVHEVLRPPDRESVLQRVRRRAASRQRVDAQAFVPAFERMLAAVRDQDYGPDAGQAVHEMWRYFQRCDWDRTWRSRPVWRAFLADAVRRQRRFDYDAASTLRTLRHNLVPLRAPVPRVDVAHSTIAGFGALPGIAAKYEYGTPLIVTEHGLFLNEQRLKIEGSGVSAYRKGFLLDFARFVNGVCYGHADVLAPVSHANGRWAVAHGADPRLIETIHHGVDPEVFVPRPKPAATAGRPTVVAALRPGPLKDVETMIRAAAVTRERVPEVRFVVHGSLEFSDYVARCRALIADLGLTDAFELAGPHPRPPEIYPQGDLSVLSSVSEGFPYAVLESMSCERPVVGTDVGGVREAIEGAGIVVPPRDPQALGDAVAALLTHEERRLELGRRAREKVLAHFTADLAAESYRRLYDRLAAPAIAG